MALERKEFRRQLHMFQKWQTENSNLREKAKAQEMQVIPLSRPKGVGIREYDASFQNGVHQARS